MTEPLVTVGDAYDLDYVSDSTSRFGAYLRQRRLLLGILLVDVEVRLRIPGLLDGPAATWTTWTCAQSWGSGPAALLEPGDTKPAVLVTASVRVPIPDGELIEPKLTRLGAVDVAEAKTAVSIVCRVVNETAGPVVEHLRGVGIGDRR